MKYEANLDFEYASVDILDNPYCIDCTYDYYIPHSLRGEIGRGCFVTVPFGRSNRKQMALVDCLTHAPSFPDAKPLDGLCEDRAPLSDEMMSLVLYMKEQVLCTVGEAVRCAVSTAAIGKMDTFYYPMPIQGPDASLGYTPSELFKVEMDGFMGENGVRAEVFVLDEQNNLTFVKEEYFTGEKYSLLLKTDLFTSYLIKLYQLD